MIHENVYTRRFVTTCPNNGQPIDYTLTIRTGSRVIPVEDIVAATCDILAGYHEVIADDLHKKFRGQQTLVAVHHGVEITTQRGELLTAATRDILINALEMWIGNEHDDLHEMDDTESNFDSRSSRVEQAETLLLTLRSGDDL